jgi:hypothetical protein
MPFVQVDVPERVGAIRLPGGPEYNERQNNTDDSPGVVQADGSR